MSLLGPERWRALEPHLDRALEMPEAERRAWLEGLRGADPALAADLESLLAEREELLRKSFLEGAAAVPPRSAPLAGQAVGAYTLIEPIGQGGMGVVWLARRSDGRFEGRVAVKLLNAGLVGRAAEERFRREGSILARLAHPHVARLLDAGVSSSGQPYIVLEHVDGQAIDRYCASRRLPVAPRLALFLEVCDAVARAHASLVVHRDIKPSNVLVGADGGVKLLDFGIAKLLEGDTGSGEATALTRDGGRALTPDFAAPEQLTGGAITTATDVYALGVLLYLLLTGRHPAGAAPRSPADLVRAVLESEPPRPSDAARRRSGEAAADAPPDALPRRLEGDLDTIVARALKKDPAERYASVAALAEDVRRHLENEPIAARPDTLGYRAGKYVARHRGGVAAAAVLAAAAIVATAAFVRQARETRRQRDAARSQLARSTATNEFLGFLLSAAAPTGRRFDVTELLEQGETLAEKEFPGDDPMRAELLVAIGRQHVTAERFEKAIPVLERAERVASRSGDPALRARAGCPLALAYMATGRRAEAETRIARALTDLPEDAEHGLERADCLTQQAEFGFVTDEGEPMIRHAREALAALDRWGVPARQVRFEARSALAYGYYLTRQNAKADAEYVDLMRTLEKSGRERTLAAVELLNNWGLVHYDGDIRRAEELYRRSAELQRAIEGGQAANPTNVFNYAGILFQLARYPEAEPLYEETIRSAKQVGLPRIEDDAIMELADLHTATGRMARADQELALVRQASGRPEFGPLRRAHLAYSEGLLDAARGDPARARGRFSEAAAIFDATNVRLSLNVFALVGLARAERALGNLREAEEAARRALSLAESFVEKGTPSYLVGHSLAALGEVQLAAGDRAAARASLAAAVEQLRRTLGDGHPAVQAASREALAPR